MLGCVRWAQLDGESSCSGDIRIKCRRVVDFKELFRISVKLQLELNPVSERFGRIRRGEEPK